MALSGIRVDELDNNCSNVINNTLLLNQPPLVGLIHQLQHITVYLDTISAFNQLTNLESYAWKQARHISEQKQSRKALTSKHITKLNQMRKIARRLTTDAYFDTSIPRHAVIAVHLSAAFLNCFTVTHNVDSILALNELPDTITGQNHELVHWSQLLHCALWLRCDTNSAAVTPEPQQQSSGQTGAWPYRSSTTCGGLVSGL